MRGEGEAKEIEKAAEDKRKEDTVSLKSLQQQCKKINKGQEPK